VNQKRDEGKMSEKPSDQLLAHTAHIRERILSHPFVRGIGDGTLPLEPFEHYVRQDYVYLIEYGRVLALGVARAHDLDIMELFAELVHATLHVEMELHRGYCERLGISREDLETTPIAPTTHAYTRHLLSVAYGGTTAELMAALLPCQWGYWEIGRALAAAGLPAEQPLYAEWIEMYSGQEYEELAERLRATFDRMAARASADEMARMSDIFVASSRYEYAFWDAAFRQEDWPV
jgi:thiaminase/transcriptional activator TenA